MCTICQNTSWILTDKFLFFQIFSYQHRFMFWHIYLFHLVYWTSKLTAAHKVWTHTLLSSKHLLITLSYLNWHTGLCFSHIYFFHLVYWTQNSQQHIRFETTTLHLVSILLSPRDIWSYTQVHDLFNFVCWTSKLPEAQ